MSKCLKVSNACLRLKTYGELKNNHEQFTLVDGNKKPAMGNHSTIHSPLLKEDDNVLVIEKCSIPKWDIFKENACRQLLQESDALDDPEIYSDAGKFAFTPFISASKAMNKIVDRFFFYVDTRPGLR